MPRVTAPYHAVRIADQGIYYGRIGLRTLEGAMREAAEADGLPELERQAYIESVAYLLRGLPPDLHRGEVNYLCHVAPAALTAAPDGDPAAMGIRGAVTARGISSDGMTKRSVPHAVTHWAVTRAFSFASVLVPLLRSLLQALVELDRRYRVPEMVIAWALWLWVAAYRRTAEVFLALCSMGDGKTGQALEDVAAYLLVGIAAGFREGVEDVVRPEKSASSEPGMKRLR